MSTILTQGEDSNSIIAFTMDKAIDSSYQRLEAIIRNFSREKMAMEETINHLKRQVELRDKNIAGINEQLRIVCIEKDLYKQTHEEDQNARYAVDATVTSNEKKLQILIDTLNSYDLALQDTVSHMESLEEFNLLVKRVFVELHNTLKDGEYHNEENVKKYTREVEELVVKHRRDLSHEIENYDKEKSTLSEINVQLSMEKQKLDHHLFTQTIDLKTKEAELAKLQEEARLITHNYENDKMTLSNTNAQLIIEKEQLENQLLASSDVLKGRVDEIQELHDEIKKLAAKHQKDLSLQLEEYEKEKITLSEINFQLSLQKQQLEKFLHIQTTDLKLKEVELEKLQEDVRLITHNYEKDKITLSETNTQLSIEREQLENQLHTSSDAMMAKVDEVQQLRVELEELAAKHQAELSYQIEEYENEKCTLSDVNVQLSLEKQKLEYHLHTQISDLKAKEVGLGKLQEEVRLITQNYEEDKITLSDTNAHLSIEKEQLENQLLTSSDAIKVKVDQVQHLQVELKELANKHEKDLSLQVQEYEKEKRILTDLNMELKKEKQQIENNLLVQMRATKEKDDELQDNVKQNSKQLQIIREGYEDLSKMLEISKNEKASLAESHVQLQEDRKQIELNFNQELQTRKEKTDVLHEEVETLRVVQKRYLDLKRHLGSLMKDKSSSSQSQSNNPRSNSNYNEKKTEKPIPKTQSTNNVTSEDGKSTKQDSSRSTPRRSYSSAPTTRSPKSILKSQSELADKKNVSFSSPLSFNVGLTSSSDSSSEPELGKVTQKGEEKVSIPQKRPYDKPDAVDSTPEKKNKSSESSDNVGGRKFIRKKPVATTPPAYRVQK